MKEKRETAILGPSLARERQVQQLMRMCWLVPACLGLAGCARMQAQNPPPPPPAVKVSLPVMKEVTDYEDFPGRMEAVNSVSLRARVTGYLDKVNFKEGAIVNKDEVLFEIDPRSYAAELARAEGNVAQSDGHLKRLDHDFDRAAMLLPRGAVGREEYDKVAGDRVEARGALDVAKASLEMARLNLAWTKVRAPLTGRISSRYVDPGNLVKADDTILTTIVSLDPIYTTFDLDERTTLRLQHLIRDGKIYWSLEGGVPVLLGLADNDGYPLRGSINFADNRVDADTGTWRLRALVKNADQALAPGMFVRVRLPIGNPYRAMLVSEKALGTDQGQKHVYVVDSSKKASYRRVKVGRLHDGLRVVTEGLAKDDKVIVTGLQRVRPGFEVDAQVIDMPLQKED
jgi:RND family efflux transporter MFP subunit